MGKALATFPLAIALLAEIVLRAVVVLLLVVSIFGLYLLVVFGTDEILTPATLEVIEKIWET